MKPFVTFGGIIYEGVKKMNGTKQKIDSKDFANPEKVFEKYADMVYRLAFVRTKNQADSDDILQEVFLRYMKVWDRMFSETHVKSMLLRITVNCSNTLKTSSWFKKTVPLDVDVPYIDNVNDGSVLKYVFKLPLKYRTVIHLHYYCGYTVTEIADITRTNPSTVKTQLSRAREMLKLDLKEEL